jgi:hypothetical protein
MAGYFAKSLPEPGPFRDFLGRVKNLPQFRQLVRQHFL